MSDLNLLPCPFCGKDDELVLDRLGGPDDWFVECDRCRLGTHAIFVGKDRAIAAWNTRAPEKGVMKKPTAYEVSVCSCWEDGPCGGKHLDWKETEHGDWMKSAEVWPILNAATVRIGELERELLSKTKIPSDGWCSSCDAVHERPTCPKCGDYLIFAVDDEPENGGSK